jgi:hypothetical protein
MSQYKKVNKDLLLKILVSGAVWYQGGRGVIVH